MLASPLAEFISQFARAGGLIAQPLNNYLKASQGWTPLQITGFITLFNLPWIIKPLYGLVSDFVPLFGYRRKSYLLLVNVAAIAGFTPLSDGELRVDTQRVVAPGPDRAVVFQQHMLFPWKTVIGNVDGAFRYLRDYPYYCWEQRLTKGVMASHYTRLRDYLPPDLEWPGAALLPQQMLAPLLLRICIRYAVRDVMRLPGAGLRKQLRVLPLEERERAARRHAFAIVPRPEPVRQFPTARRYHRHRA